MRRVKSTGLLFLSRLLKQHAVENNEARHEVNQKRVLLQLWDLQASSRGMRFGLSFFQHTLAKLMLLLLLACICVSSLLAEPF